MRLLEQPTVCQMCHIEHECTRSGQRVENWRVCVLTSAGGMNDRRMRRAPGLFLARPVTRCCWHILNESTGKVNSLNVLTQKKYESALFSQRH